MAYLTAYPDNVPLSHSIVGGLDQRVSARTGVKVFGDGIDSHKAWETPKCAPAGTGPCPITKHKHNDSIIVRMSTSSRDVQPG